MRVLESKEEARLFYRERYGLDIVLFSDVIRQSLENLYFRGVRLSRRALINKFAKCGISLQITSLEHTRLWALTRKVQAEPPSLNHQGARFWYISQPKAFSQEELGFLAKHFPLQMQRLYPSLWKGFLMMYQRNNLPEYVKTELLDSDECIFQQHCERSKRKGNAAFAV